MANSINTNISAYFAQANISTAANASSSSVARLSSGNRIVKASDDVAALSTGTSLRTQVLALRTALTNASQGTSLLQVADGALSQVTEILQRQKAISLQAGSGSLTDTDRGYLDQEFQALSTEIDRLTGSTNFNGVKLLNGSLSTSASVADVETNSTKGSLSLNFGSSNILVGEVVNINGTIMTAVASGATGAQFNLGASITETVANLADRLNTLADNSSYNTTIGDAVFSSSGSTLIADARGGGTLSNMFRLENAPPAATAISSGGISVTNASTSVVVTTSATHSLLVGQRVILNSTTNAAIGGIAHTNLRGVITAVTGTTFTFTAQAAATSTTTGGGASATAILDAANTFDESTVTGGSQSSYFNLFATTTGFTSATTAISNATTAVATPFKDGDNFTATVNGTTYTLHTFGTNDTLKGLVDGINASAPNTGFSADLIMDSNNRYNVRIKYEGNAGNIIINGGTNYHSAAAATNLLTGDNLSSLGAGTNGTVGAFTSGYTGKSIISTGYVDVTGAAGSVGITAATTGATVTDTLASGVAAADPFVVGESLTATVNGEVKILHTFAASDTLDIIIASINAKQDSTGIYAAILSDADGAGAFNIRLYATVPTPASDQVLVSAGPNIGGVTSSTVTKLTTTSGGLSQVTTSTTKGGVDNGIGRGDTSITGSVGDSILQSLGTTKANASLLFTAVPTANDSITVGGQAFYFTSNTTAAPNEILIGSTVQETINNAIKAIHNYVADGHAVGTTAYELNQLELSATSNSLVFTAKGMGTVKTLAGGNSAIAESSTNIALVGGTLNNSATNYGVDVTGVSNSKFTGTISGFQATYTGTADTIDLSVTIGDFTYTAQDVDATVTSDTRIRLYSNTVGGENGGYFDIQLKANEIASFTTQGAADVIASRLNGAFSSLNFLQTRNVSSYTGSGSITSNGSVIGTLQGSSVQAQLKDFDNVNLSDISVTAPSGSNTDAKISLTINGVVYSTASGIGSTLGAHQTYKMVSAEDPNQFISFTTGNTTIVIDSAEKALAVQAALKNAFGAIAGSSALSFQIGASADDTLSVSIGSATTSSLYSGKELNVLTQAAAVEAGAQLDVALQAVTTLRASVGALQSRFNFAATNIQIAVQNQDAARGELLDTDVATESTAFATSQVKLQAGISVLAQANQQLQNLLKLIQ